MDEDFSDKFDEYSIEFAKKLEYSCHGDWNLLDGDEQEIAALGSSLSICTTAVSRSFSATGATTAIGSR